MTHSRYLGAKVLSGLGAMRIRGPVANISWVPIIFRF